MGFLPWAQQEWFNLLQSVGIVAGLAFTAITIRKEAMSRRVSNRISIVQNHREIWSLLYARPELARILQAEVDLKQSPVTNDEAIFLTFVILHLSTSFQAISDDLVVRPDGLKRDIRWFLRLPIPKTTWEKSKNFQNERFVAFVEECLAEKV